VLGEILKRPVVTVASKVDLAGSNIRVERNVPDGYEVIEMQMPGVVTVGDEIGLPRLPTGIGIVQATRKEFDTWTSNDLGIDVNVVGDSSRRTTLLEIFVPSSQVEGEDIVGDDATAKAGLLAKKLRESGLL
jgi:electron transfer flavoprotein beta subunit